MTIPERDFVLNSFVGKLCYGTNLVDIQACTVILETQINISVSTNV